MLKDIASQIGVDKTSIFNREANTSQPALRPVPAVIRFLGYNPLPSTTTVGESLVRHRTSLGMSQEEAAQQIGVDPCTLARWERDERKPTGTFAEAVNDFLDREDREVRACGKAG